MSHPTVPGTGGSPIPVLRAPLIGRSHELDEIDGALARTLSSGQPEIVTILGGAGVGKTRLTDEALSRIKARERRVRAFRAAARDGGPSLGVIQRLLRARFSLPAESEPDMARDLVRQAVTEVLGDRRVAEFLHFLGVFLDLTFPESPFVKAFEDDPEQVARMSRAVLRRFFEVDAQASPLVLVLEDLHHASDDGLDLVQGMIDQMRDAPVLILTTARPELLVRRSAWVEASGARHRRIELAPLAENDAEQVVMHLLERTGDPPEALVQAAVDVAGGSPFLLEQMVRIYFEKGVLTAHGAGPWTVDLGKIDDAQLPLTVDQAIAARIAALSPAERGLLEQASVMGGVFWLGALVSLGREGKKAPPLWGGAEDLGAQYRDTLASLADRDYVLQLPDSSMHGEPEYAFKHNLEREALYALLGQAPLRRMHLAVAEWMEPRFASRSEEHCEMLAEQYEKGGAPRRAAEMHVAAGDRARERYANAKAATHYERGIALLGEDDPVRRIDALHNAGDVQQLAGRNEEAIATFRKMLELAWRLDLRTKGGVAHNRIGRVYRAIGHLEEAMRYLGTGHALFDSANDQRGVASSLDDVGKVHWMRGAYEPAERFMAQSLEIRRELGDPRSIALSLNNVGLVYHDSGRFTEAARAWEEALVIRREIGDRPGLSQTLNNLATTHQDSGDHVRASELWTEALEVSRQVGDRMRTSVILTNLGESFYRQGHPERAIEVLREAEAMSSMLGDRILEGEILRGLAKAHMMTKDIKAARELIDRSIELFEQAKGKPFLGVALRTAGEIEAAGGWGGDSAGGGRAKQHFEASIRLFEGLGNQVELARSCIAYAQFLASDPEAATDSVRAHEIQRLRARADEVQGKLAAKDGAPLEGERTNPGGPAPVAE